MPLTRTINHTRHRTVSATEYAELLKKQRGKCAICRVKPLAGTKLVIDHDHSDGKIRGLLCHNCNIGLGHLKDNIKIVTKAVFYLLGK